MMNNMFSMFDPSSHSTNFAWMILMAPMLLMSFSANKKNSKKTKIFIIMKNFMKNEMTQLMEKKSKKFSNKIMISLFLNIMILNMLALMPFTFNTTAHMSFTTTLSMTMWMSTILWGWVNSFKFMMTHLTPKSTPSSLMNFMVLIEVMSNIIRPITLSVRLSANMVAGHLLMLLLSNFSMLNSQNSLLSMLMMMILTFLEIMVSMIQSYVIVTLITLYQNESMK